MSTRLLLLDNYDSFTYNLAHGLREIGVEDFTVIRNDKVDLSTLSQYTHILLSPGPGIPSEGGKMMELIELVKSQSSVSVLGVCLGHQALAESFGGKLINLKEVVHGKEEVIAIDSTSPIFKSLPKNISVGRYHSWAVDPRSLPAEIKVTAATDDNEVMALAHSELPYYGVQFHPESVMTDTGITILKNWVEGPR